MLKYLGEFKEEYDLKSVIKAMIEIDVSLHSNKIKDSFKYFDENNKEIIGIIGIILYLLINSNKLYLVRVLWRSYMTKESIIKEAVANFKNESSHVYYDGCLFMKI